MLYPEWMQAANRDPGLRVAEEVQQRLVAFVRPLLVELDRTLDVRLVRTFLATLEAILMLRAGGYGLLLSELGAYILAPHHAPAGTKRLTRLLRSPNWQGQLIERFLWRQGQARAAELTAQGHTTLVVWDESQLEKPESRTLEGLCSVRSTRTARLTRIKPGFFQPPPERPTFVPGQHWLGLLVLGLSGPPTVAAMRWWTTRGQYASDRRTQERALLRQCAITFGQRVVHVFDRGFAGGPWLSTLAAYQARFVVRWPKGYRLHDATGRTRLAWEIARGKRSWAQRPLWDARRRCWRKTGVLALPVSHSVYARPLWLVVSRPGQGRPPWYLLTNEPIAAAADAWRIVLAYARRWQIEQTWRFGKTELAMQSPRLRAWEQRLKLLGMVSLVYAFLLSLLDRHLYGLRLTLQRFGCHRTGQRSRDASAPLYRLRAAIAYLWLLRRFAFTLFLSSG